jgi:hypothetical protein
MNNASHCQTSANVEDMVYHLLADLVVVIHLLFVLFVLFGGLLVLCWRFITWIHIPAVFWAALIEFSGWICPLTPLENRLRIRGGSTGYDTGFVEHYIIPLLYPSQLTRKVQIYLGVLILVMNIVIYLWVWYARGRRSKKHR